MIVFLPKEKIMNVWCVQQSGNAIAISQFPSVFNEKEIGSMNSFILVMKLSWQNKYTPFFFWLSLLSLHDLKSVKTFE